MREPRKDPKRLSDILEAIDNIFQYVGDDDMAVFVADHMRYHAVGMRNFLIHGYHQVEKDIVWKVIEEDLHLLRPQIVDYLAELQ